MSSKRLDDLTAAYLREILDYDPETGIFRWRCHRSGVTAGAVAGGVGSTCEYFLIQIDGRKYVAHRLAWLWMTGDWPGSDLDHIDVDPLNNCWSNLRLATNKQNCANKGPQINNKSGRKGVCWKKKSKRWCAQITINGKRRHLGYFDTAEAAANTYATAATIHFGEYARTK